MVLELAAAVLMVAIFVPLARRIATGATRGRFWNMFEVMVLFIRDQVARPAIGGHDADRFLPFLWTLFFFILLLNLIGLLPWVGSATADIWVTGTLAVITFVTVIGTGIAKFGPVRFWLGQVPHMDVPLVMGVFLRPMIFVIEVFGLLIKHSILAVRLFANMFAGHLVLAVRGRVHRGDRAHVALVRRDACQRARRGGAESVGTHGGVDSSLRIHFFGGLVHRHGDPPALTRSIPMPEGQ